MKVQKDKSSHNHIHQINYMPAISSFILLAGGIIMDYLQLGFFNGYIRLIYYLIPFILVGLDVLKNALKLMAKGKIFTEFFLMSIATIGAFLLGDYQEGVAVMLFYTIGELFQHGAVHNVRQNIQALLDMRPDIAYANVSGKYHKKAPQEVKIGDTIRVRNGEKVPLDGILLESSSFFNTAAITGESLPRHIEQGTEVLAGMINLGKVVELKVSRSYEDSALSKILKMVREASTRKGKTEKFMRKVARIYTPVVCFLALSLVLIPWLIVDNYSFNQWFYRALIFLVISCPCGLVISIPLAYFGGIGAGSQNGILFKGGNFIDLLARTESVVMDKTGTLTEGNFTIREIKVVKYTEELILKYAATLSHHSTHPISQAITGKLADHNLFTARKINEVEGHGIHGIIDEKHVILGNKKMMEKYAVPDVTYLEETTDTIIYIVVQQEYVGHIALSDRIKDTAAPALKELKQLGIKHLALLSGDKESVVGKIAAQLGVSEFRGNLLPEGKVKYVETYKEQYQPLAFVGDGVNDAPVLAVADIGIAMGGMGSDAAIETADIVIQTDQISKIPTAIKISRFTRIILWQNISFAFSIKVIILVLGTLGMASMWGAVFADVGVALLAILNAMRVQYKKYEDKPGVSRDN